MGHGPEARQASLVHKGFIMLPGQEAEPDGFWELLLFLLKVFAFPLCINLVLKEK